MAAAMTATATMTATTTTMTATTTTIVSTMQNSIDTKQMKKTKKKIEVVIGWPAVRYLRVHLDSDTSKVPDRPTGC